MKKDELIGKSVVGTLRIYNADETIREIVEIVGQIMTIDENGVLICNHDTRNALTVPAALEKFKPAEKGYYVLHNGTKIKNPDIICDMAVIDDK